jgi:hypothetical protein
MHTPHFDEVLSIIVEVCKDSKCLCYPLLVQKLSELDQQILLDWKRRMNNDTRLEELREMIK